MGERGDARRIDPAFCVLASLDPGQGRATRMARDVEALLASAQAAVRAAAAELPSAADLRVEAARAEALAASGAGAVAKTAAGVGASLRRQWLRWVAESTARRTGSTIPRATVSVPLNMISSHEKSN